MSRKIGVVRFLGTNCDADVYRAVDSTNGLEAHWLWYEDHFNINDYDGLVLPGGFSYGDYLRSGALAAKTTVMDDVEAFAKQGGPVLGICNGFQVLTERGLLPGALVKNKELSFIDRWVTLKSESKNSLWSLNEKECRIPIAHGDGCFYVTNSELETLRSKDQVWLTYKDNPNGSVGDIAGVLNEDKNVAALMPHPERAMSTWMGSQHGKEFFEKLLVNKDI